ncbi:putative membrane protein [Plasmodium gaboni]|uniref:Putative membrane protein n=1 Tax=Plasmodium gaboni TaxID=647221 RepID=A0A151LFV3_9APIC|nr:putative membrane protein [Plasmodium gaboni]KYN97834.1 putative membrane protein [Plasmodium gaboni]
MDVIENDLFYRDSKRNAVLFFIFSLFCNFIKIILFVFNIWIFCFSTLVTILFMFFGYFGVISDKPLNIHVSIYIGTIYVDIILNMLITVFSFYKVYLISVNKITFFENNIVNRYFFYCLTSVNIFFCFISTVLNIFCIYYTERFKTFLRLSSKDDKKDKISFNLNNLKYIHGNNMNEYIHEKKKKKKKKGDNVMEGNLEMNSIEEQNNYMSNKTKCNSRNFIYDFDLRNQENNEKVNNLNKGDKNIV